jgi:hypothetical protein
VSAYRQNAELIITTDGTTSPWLPNLEADLQAAWSRFASRFDYLPASSTIIRISIQPGVDSAMASAPDGFTQVGLSGRLGVEENSILQNLLTGHSTGVATARLIGYAPYLQNAYAPNGPWIGDPSRALDHELQHVAGDDFSLYDRDTHLPIGAKTVYDENVQFDGNGRGWFVGAEVEAAFGSGMPLHASIDHSWFSIDQSPNHVGSVMDYYNTPWTAVASTDLDAAIMKDSGEPILTQNELAEHAFIRMADVLHYTPTADVVEVYAHLYQKYGSLNVVAERILFALHRTDMTFGQLVATSDSEEERAKGAFSPNEFYSHTLEHEVQAVGIIATGHVVDPVTYGRELRAAINGETLGQVTLNFLRTPASVANFRVVDHRAAVAKVMAQAGYDFSALPAAVKSQFMAMDFPTLVQVATYTVNDVRLLAGLGDGLLRPAGILPTLLPNHLSQTGV